MEADVFVRGDPDKTDAIDVNLGEGSDFHGKYGYYVQGADPADFAHLPAGWEVRTVKIQHPVYTDNRIGHCLGLLDLFLSKASANRPKDKDFCTAMLTHEYVALDEVLPMISTMPIDDAAQARLTRNIKRWAKEAGIEQ